MRCILGLDPADVRDGDRARAALPRAGPPDAPGGRADRPARPASRADGLRATCSPWPRATGCPLRGSTRCIDLVGLDSVADDRVRGFSLGMGQRLGIAAALLGDPDVLLLDEPVNGLDPEGIRWVRELLRDLADEGRTVLVSSHLMSEMEDTADHLVVLGRGRLLADVPMAELLGAHAVGAGAHPAGDRLLADALRRAGGRVELEIDGALRVEGLDLAEVGDVAFVADVRLHELSRGDGVARGRLPRADRRRRRVPGGVPVSRAVPFRAVLRSEWTKLRSLRSTWWCAAVYVVVVLAFGWLARRGHRPGAPRRPRRRVRAHRLRLRPARARRPRRAGRRHRVRHRQRGRLVRRRAAAHAACCWPRRRWSRWSPPC